MPQDLPPYDPLSWERHEPCFHSPKIENTWHNVSEAPDTPEEIWRTNVLTPCKLHIGNLVSLDVRLQQRDSPGKLLTSAAYKFVYICSFIRFQAANLCFQMLFFVASKVGSAAYTEKGEILPLKNDFMHKMDYDSDETQP